MARRTLQRISKKPAPPVEAWIVYLKRALESRQLKKYSGEDLLVRTAGLIALFGGPEEGRGNEVYKALTTLFFHHQRILVWGKALDAIPATRDDVSRIAAAVKASAHLEPVVEKARFPLLHFISVSLILPDARAYVEVCRRENIVKIYSAFYPNTVEYIKVRYRGVIGELADPGYKDQVAAKLKTVV